MLQSAQIAEKFAEVIPTRTDFSLTFFPACLSTMAPSLSLPGLAMVQHLTSCDGYSAGGSSCTWRQRRWDTQELDNQKYPFQRKQEARTAKQGSRCATDGHKVNHSCVSGVFVREQMFVIVPLCGIKCHFKHKWVSTLGFYLNFHCIFRRPALNVIKGKNYTEQRESQLWGPVKAEWGKHPLRSRVASPPILCDVVRTT